AERFLELLQRVGVVGRDGNDLRALGLDLRVPVPVRLHLLRSTTGEGLREEGEDDRTLLQEVVQRDGVAVAVRQREVGRLGGALDRRDERGRRRRRLRLPRAARERGREEEKSFHGRECSAPGPRAPILTGRRAAETR